MCSLSISPACRCLLKYVLDCETKPVHRTLNEYNLPKVEVVCDREYDRILQDEDLDAVLVTTPTNTHEDYIQQAIRANKAIFCEKPVASSVAGIAQCYSEADKAGKPLFCAFNRRFDPSLLGMSLLFSVVHIICYITFKYILSSRSTRGMYRLPLAIIYVAFR